MIAIARMQDGREEDVISSLAGRSKAYARGRWVCRGNGNETNAPRVSCGRRSCSRPTVPAERICIVHRNRIGDRHLPRHRIAVTVRLRSEPQIAHFALRAVNVPPLRSPGLKHSSPRLYDRSDFIVQLLISRQRPRDAPGGDLWPLGGIRTPGPPDSKSGDGLFLP